MTMNMKNQKWEEEAEVPDPKTSLENADPMKKNQGLENADLTKKNHGLKERRTGEEEAAQVMGKVKGGTRVLKLEFHVDFFSTSVSTACNSSFKNSISILEFEFSTLDMLVC